MQYLLAFHCNKIQIKHTILINKLLCLTMFVFFLKLFSACRNKIMSLGRYHFSPASLWLLLSTPQTTGIPVLTRNLKGTMIFGIMWVNNIGSGWLINCCLWIPLTSHIVVQPNDLKNHCAKILCPLSMTL